MRSISAPDRWLYAVPSLGILHAVLFVTLQARPGLTGVVLWHVGPLALTLAAIVVMLYGLWQSRRARLTWTAGRTAGYAGLLAVTVMPMAYSTYPSSRDQRPSEVRFRLPLDGPITVVWGGATRAVNYHVIAPAERWGYDLRPTPQGGRGARPGGELADYYAYGRPVLAAAGGVVQAVSDGAPDRRLGSFDRWLEPCGNHVVLRVAPDEFLFFCHLQAGSIGVRPGQRVSMGQPIARVGNSGRSTEPHLHVHLQTTARHDFGEGIPLYFHDYWRDGRFTGRGLPTGGPAAQIVEHAGSAGEGLHPVRHTDEPLH